MPDEYQASFQRKTGGNCNTLHTGEKAWNRDEPGRNGAVKKQVFFLLSSTTVYPLGEGDEPNSIFPARSPPT